MRGKSLFRHLARVLMMALVVQSWLLTVTTIALSSQLDAMVICTGTGYKIVNLPDVPGDPSDSEPDHAGSLDCAACLVQALAKADAPLNPDGILRHDREAERAGFSDRQAPHRLDHSPQQSRAPPATDTAPG